MSETTNKKGVAILGSTGSIGTQALEVIKEHAHHFQVEVLTAGNNWQLLREQALAFQPNAVVIQNQEGYETLSDELWHAGIKVYQGPEALAEVVQMDGVDIVLTALVGFAGLQPTIKAIEAKKDIALANKETLVVAGEMITDLARKKGVNIYPVDSEHSAIFQCMAGEWQNPIENITLTASGGPFFGQKRSDLQEVLVKDALKHPNWNMGAKITIDSATMMNKGLEVIEAKWLFHLNPNQVEVVVHRESIIHSMVQYVDGSVKAQMGLPDMKLPILYALSYPRRLKTDWPRMNLAKLGRLTFFEPDTETFRNLPLAFEALEKGGNACCVLNAANEVAVDMFLHEQIGFLDIAEMNEKILEKYPIIAKPTTEDLVETDREVRKRTREMLMKK